MEGRVRLEDHPAVDCDAHAHDTPGELAPQSELPWRKSLEVLAGAGRGAPDGVGKVTRARVAEPSRWPVPPSCAAATRPVRARGTPRARSAWRSLSGGRAG